MPRSLRCTILPLAGLAALLMLSACAEPKPEEPARQAGHMFSDEQSGVALELPVEWAGRYQVSDSIAVPAPGLVRELTLRFIRSDSSVTPQPLAIVRLLDTPQWNALSVDSASARWGVRIAGDAAHTVAIAPAPANPLQSGTADALGFDTLMIALNQHPLRGFLRATKR